MKKAGRIIALIAVFALILIAIVSSSVNQVNVSEEIWNPAMTAGNVDDAIRHYIVYTDLMCPYCNYYVFDR